MGEIKDLIDAVPKAYAGYLLIFAPTLFCIWLKAEDTYRQFYTNNQDHNEIVSVLTVHNNTLLQNQRLMLTQGNMALAMCLNTAEGQVQMARCTDAAKQQLIDHGQGGF